MELLYLFGGLLLGMVVIVGFFDLIGLHAVGIVVYLFFCWIHFSTIGEFSRRNQPRK